MDLSGSMQNAAKSPASSAIASSRADHKVRTDLIQRETRVPGVDRALVIDDHLPTSEFIGEVLRACEIETYNTSDSKLAEARLRREKFDVVFVDAKMPAPDGLELARKIRASGPNQRATIVMITGEQGHDFMKRVFEAGVNFVVFKPVDRQALMRLLRVTQGSVERERRRYTRINTARNVVMEFDGKNSFGTTVEMSLTGMQVKMNRTLPINSIVLTTLELKPDAPRVTFKSRVVRHIDDDGMGLEYDGMDAQVSQQLEDFLLPRVLEMARRKTMIPAGQAAVSTPAR